METGFVKHLLTIGEFARLSGIKRVNLIYYDQLDLFSPEVTRENGYRYYSHRQLDTASVISALKEIGVPLKQIKTYLDERSPERMELLFSEQKKQIDREIRKLQGISSMMQARIDLTHQGTHINPDSISLVDCKAERLLISDPIDNEGSIEDSILHFYDSCIDHGINNGYPIGAILPRENLLAGDCHAWSHYFIKPKRIDSSMKSILKPAGLYVVGYMKGNYLKTDNLYERLLKYCRNHQLSLCGDAYEETLLDEVALKNPDEYLSQISIQVTRL